MPFPACLPPPAAAAAATAAAVLAAVALRRYLSSRPRAATSAHRSSSTAPAAAGATTRLVLSGKSPQDQQLLASAAGELSLEEEGGGELAVSLAPDGGGAEGFDAGAYMGALLARRFGRWMLWSPRMASTHDLVTQNLAKLPVGVVCVTDVQFKGRGRSKNVWESPPGIGLNVNNDKPTTCLNAALQELEANSPRLTREDILASFFNKFEVLFEIFSNQGFQALEERYYNAWLHSGQRVVVQDAHEGQSVNSVVTIQGLTPSGYLYAIGEDGKSYELHPDGNSFDFFTGLVRRKM